MSDAEKKWKKNCHQCGGEQVYSCKSVWTLSIRKNTICNKCRASKTKIFPENGIWKRICKCGKEMIYSCRRSYNTGKRTNSICGKCATNKSAKLKDISWMRSDNYRLKMSESIKKARKTDSYGEEFKQKCRLNKAKYVQMGVGSKPNYNKVACKFIDNINNKFGWELQHAENGGEKMISGFFVDGYDKNRNIVFEYDEPKHFTLSHEKRDRIKEKVIIKNIHPLKFIRYNERNSKMCDIITGKEML